MLCLPPPSSRSEAKPIFAVIQLSPVQYHDSNTLVMTETSVTAVDSLYISRRKRWRCCPCAFARVIRCKTISLVKLSQFTYLEAYVDRREGDSA